MHHTKLHDASTEDQIATDGNCACHAALGLRCHIVGLVPSACLCASEHVYVHSAFRTMLSRSQRLAGVTIAQPQP